MKKYCLGNHPEIVIKPDREAIFFGAGGQFPQDNLEEKIKEVIMGKSGIIVIGEGNSKFLITAPTTLLKSIQKTLEDNIGIPLNLIDNLAIPG